MPSLSTFGGGNLNPIRSGFPNPAPFDSWALYTQGSSYNYSGSGWRGASFPKSTYTTLGSVNDFTIDFFHKRVEGGYGFSVVLEQAVVDEGQGNNNGWTLEVENTSFKLTNSSGGVYVEGTIKGGANGVWKHYTCMRKSGTTYLFVNGAVVGSTSSTVDMDAAFVHRPTTPTHINGHEEEYWNSSNGYTSNVRIVKGYAYSPPRGGSRSILTSVPGTGLLTLQNSSLIDNGPYSLSGSIQNSSIQEATGSLTIDF